jgi:hypothetical protein
MLPICNTVRPDTFAVAVYAASRSGDGRWSILATDNRHPCDCAVIHRVDAIDEPLLIPPRLLPPPRLRRWFESIGSQVTRWYCVAERRHP